MSNPSAARDKDTLPNPRHSKQDSACPPSGEGVEGSGRFSSMTRNVVANWAGHVLFVISGFILPRLINDQIGQERLGVWDFGWSTVSYFSLLTAGIASSVNRYVAKYRATEEWGLLNKTVSSCACIFAAAAFAGCAVTLVLVRLLPRILPTSFSPYLVEAQYLLFFLGLAASIDLFVPTFVGVISGVQRYDILAAIESLSHLTLLVLVVFVLEMGYGLKAMGIPVLGMRVVEGILKFVFSHRLCPTLRLSVTLVSADSLRKVLTFGAKTLSESSARLLLYQGNNLLVALFLGPAAVAVYARSMVLILHANKLMFHFARVFAPSASHLQARQDEGALRDLMLKSAQYSGLLAVPMVVVLTVLGDSLLRIWMGSAYASVPVLPILALGHLAVLAQKGSFFALMGLNRHGRASLAVFGAALLSLAMSSVALGLLDWGLMGVAASVALSITVPYLVIVPRKSAAAAGLSLRRYSYEALAKPLALCLPFLLCLLSARWFFPGSDYLALSFGLGSGGIALGCCYWRWALSLSAKQRLAGAS